MQPGDGAEPRPPVGNDRAAEKGVRLRIAADDARFHRDRRGAANAFDARYAADVEQRLVPPTHP
jgi:hypothetical protein